MSEFASVSELARRLGVKKQSLSERVTRFETLGLLQTKPGAGRAKLIPVEAFTRLVAEHGDPAKARGAETERLKDDAPDQAAPGGDPVYAREAAREKRFKADIAELELARRRGEVVAVADAEQAMLRCAEALVRRIDELPQQAEAIATATAADGLVGARAALKRAARDLRAVLASEMRLLEAAAAPPPAASGEDEP